MNPEALKAKRLTIFALSHCVLQLEEEKGHLKWKVTDLVRRSRLSRSLIYRYLGGDKETMLTQALRNFCQEFYGFGHGGEAIPFEQRIKSAREIVSENPSSILFYQKWRSKKSSLQSEFMTVESKFQKKLQKLFSKLNESELLALQVFVHGLVTAPFLSPEKSAELSAMIAKRYNP